MPFAQTPPSGFAAFDAPATQTPSAPPRPGSSADGGKAWETLYREYAKDWGQIEDDDDEIKQRLQHLRGLRSRRVRIGRQGYD